MNPLRRLLCWMDRHKLQEVYIGYGEGSDVLMCEFCCTVRYRLREPKTLRGMRL